MFRFKFFIPTACALLLISSPARAEPGSSVPNQSMLAEVSAGEQRATFTFRDFEKLQQGQLNFDFGSLDYRFAGKGFQTSLRVGRISANALIAYSGEHRLEFDWRLHGRNLKLAVTPTDGVRAYRIELVRSF